MTSGLCALKATENHFRTFNRSMTKGMAHSHPMVGGSRMSPMSPGNTKCGCNRSRQGQGKWQISADIRGALALRNMFHDGGEMAASCTTCPAMERS